MGSLISIFRSKSDTKALLEKIQNEIESIEDFKDSASKREKNCICLLFTAFVLIYFMSAIVFYILYRIPNSYTEIILCFSLFIISPFIFYLVKRLLQSYYQWIGDNKEDRLKELKKQKKKILEKVKETENFKDAKEILEKYDPKALFDSVSFRTLNACTTPLLNAQTQRMTQNPDSQLRYRGINTTPMRPMPAIMSSPSYARQSTPAFRPNLMIRGPMMSPQRGPPMLPMPPPIRTIKPILPQSRSVMEKLVDYVVGDGPNNRFALICIHCYSHNGMALKEEFEFIAFVCCYCKRFNPSRRTRPLAPRLQPLDQNRSSLTPVVDEPESDTDSERGRISAENSTTIQEITSSNETNDENRDESQTEDTVDKQSNGETVGQTSETETNIEGMSGTDDTVIEDKHDVNTEKLEEKEIPFMDESDL